MTYVNEQFEKYMGIQQELYAPAQAIGGALVETFERLARQHYDVLGDYVNFAVEQARLPSQVGNVNELFGRQVETSRAFGEKLARRAQEYVEIVQREQSKAEEIIVANDPAEKRAPKKAA